MSCRGRCETIVASRDDLVSEVLLAVGARLQQTLDPAFGSAAAERAAARVGVADPRAAGDP